MLGIYSKHIDHTLYVNPMSTVCLVWFISGSEEPGFPHWVEVLQPRQTAQPVTNQQHLCQHHQATQAGCLCRRYVSDFGFCITVMEAKLESWFGRNITQEGSRKDSTRPDC